MWAGGGRGWAGCVCERECERETLTPTLTRLLVPPEAKAAAAEEAAARPPAAATPLQINSDYLGSGPDPPGSGTEPPLRRVHTEAQAYVASVSRNFCDKSCLKVAKRFIRVKVVKC